MSKNTNKETARLLGIRYAESLYETFCDEKYRGINFKWDKFPEIASGMAKVSTFTSFRENIKGLKELEEICSNACKEKAEEILIKHLTKDGNNAKQEKM